MLVLYVFKNDDFGLNFETSDVASQCYDVVVF